MPIRTPIAAVPVFLAIVCFFFWESIIEPDRLKDSKHVLEGAKTIPIPNGHGPEGLEFDPQGGGPYVGVTDGRILKWSGEELGWVDFAHTSPHRNNCTRDAVVPSCGRPLGLTFDRKTGDLYICDGYFGLMRVGPEGGLAELLLGDVEGRSVTFANQGDIDEEDGIYYFNDSSDQYHFGEVFYVSISGDRVGRVVRYDIKKKEAKVIMDKLHLPNGLAASKDGSFVVICEGGTSILHRLWVKGPKAGTSEVFARVPGLPDNIRRTPSGDFWVALHCKYNFFTPVMKILKMETVIHLMNGGKPHGIVMKLSGETGEVLHMLEDSEGKTMNYVSEAYEREDGTLWFGSVYWPAVWVMNTSVYDRK
ncbi:PREDICTED: protein STRICTOSIDINE SYNTHASE-LIKE 8-like [Camelina sativa]|uniref:Protein STRICTOSIDINE SYNTHASE-LIKE 8-like n=1 Tax=Camelina sativa TaxID=90675 RepID=A0ABM1QFR5_CAMSA|nr:PREDICTED: protein STRICTOSIDINE SYNTHASE-LIKE 8-like [Camelina sativa]